MDIPQGRKQAPGQSKRQVEKIHGKNGRASTPKGRNISHTNSCESLRYYKPTLGPMISSSFLPLQSMSLH
jgi:hypothetical protein